MEAMKYAVSAPGKIIMSGEHAVVYGKLALAASVNLRTRIEVTRSTAPIISVDLIDLNAQVHIDLNDELPFNSGLKFSGVPKFDDDLARDLKEFLDRKNFHEGDQRLYSSLLSILYLYVSIVNDRTGVHLKIQSQLPLSSGLGSSASFSVCLAASFMILKGGQLGTVNHDDVSRWAWLSEELFHATPSGIDNAICANGGLIQFRKGQFQAGRIPVSRILLVNTKVPRQTKLLVQAVRSRKERFPQVMENILDSLENVSKELVDLLHKEPLEFDRLQELLSINHWLLASMGVSHEALDSICNLAKKYNHAAKLTGAGGGGMAFVWLRPDAVQSQVDELMDQYRQMGFECWETQLGVPGVQTEILNS